MSVILKGFTVIDEEPGQYGAYILAEYAGVVKLVYYGCSVNWDYGDTTVEPEAYEVQSRVGTDEEKVIKALLERNSGAAGEHLLSILMRGNSPVIRQFVQYRDLLRQIKDLSEAFDVQEIYDLVKDI